MICLFSSLELNWVRLPDGLGLVAPFQLVDGAFGCDFYAGHALDLGFLDYFGLWLKFYASEILRRGGYLEHWWEEGFM